MGAVSVEPPPQKGVGHDGVASSVGRTDRSGLGVGVGRVCRGMRVERQAQDMRCA